MPSSATRGITRRDLLKKGAALGGAVVWVTPIVQSVGMGRAFAQAPSPCTPGISYIAMNISCLETDGEPDPFGVPVLYFIKWEDGQMIEWEVDPGSVPGCSPPFTPDGLPAAGGLPEEPNKGFVVTIDSSGFATVVPGPECTVLEGVVKGGQLCSTLTDLMVSLPADMPFTVGCPTG